MTPPDGVKVTGPLYKHPVNTFLVYSMKPSLKNLLVLVEVPNCCGAPRSTIPDYGPDRTNDTAVFERNVCNCGLVVSAPARDGTGCEFDSWQCRIYIPCSLSLRLLGSLRGSLGTIRYLLIYKNSS